MFHPVFQCQVLLDVVFNHTAEGNENGPILSFRGADNSTYYMLAPKVLAFISIAWFSHCILKE